jgi:membrane-associated phospholipid phosphatase
MTGDDALEPRRRPHAGQRMRLTFANARRRVARHRGRPGPAVWPPAMTALALAGLLATAATALLDAKAAAYPWRDASPLFRVLAAITDIGQSHWYLIPALLCILIAALLDWSGRNSRQKMLLARIFGHAAFVFTAVALSGILTNIVKLLVGRARPRAFDELGAFSFDPFTPGHLYGSFPSGHATTCGAVAAIAMLWFPALRLPALVLGLAAAFSRIPAGAHYPSDAVAGFVLGLLYTLFLARWLASRRTVFRFDGNALPPTPR